ERILVEAGVIGTRVRSEVVGDVKSEADFEDFVRSEGVDPLSGQVCDLGIDKDREIGVDVVAGEVGPIPGKPAEDAIVLVEVMIHLDEVITDVSGDGYSSAGGKVLDIGLNKGGVRDILVKDILGAGMDAGRRNHVVDERNTSVGIVDDDGADKAIVGCV